MMNARIELRKSGADDVPSYSAPKLSKPSFSYTKSGQATQVRINGKDYRVKY